MKISRKKLIAAVLTCMIFTLMMSTTAWQILNEMTSSE